MKQYSIGLVLAAGLALAISGTGCQSSAEKLENAQNRVSDAKQDLKVVEEKADAAENNAVDAQAWQTFRNESQIRIRDNEDRIAELKGKANTSGKALNTLYMKRIEELEEKNRSIIMKMDRFDQGQQNWESFKREVEHDMDEIGQALKDLAVDNKN